MTAAAVELRWVRSPLSATWYLRTVRHYPRGWVDALTGTTWPESVPVVCGHPDAETETALALAYRTRWEAANASQAPITTWTEEPMKRETCPACGAPETQRSHDANACVPVGAVPWRTYECGRTSTDGPDLTPCDGVWPKPTEVIP